MRNQRFRLKSATIAVLISDGARIAVTVPADETITVLRDFDGAPLVPIEWNGKTLEMFAQDIRERGEQVGQPVRSDWERRAARTGTDR